MDRCETCDAPMREGAEWCPQCLRRSEDQRPQEWPGLPEGFEHPRLRPQPEPPVKMFSRTERGPTSFGWMGRSIVSVLTLFAASWMATHSAFALFRTYGRAGDFLVAVIFVPGVIYALWRIWRSRRVR